MGMFMKDNSGMIRGKDKVVINLQMEICTYNFILDMLEIFKMIRLKEKEKRNFLMEINTKGNG